MKQPLNLNNLSSRAKAYNLFYAIIFFLLLLLLVLIAVSLQMTSSKETKVIKVQTGNKALWRFSISNYRDKSRQSLNFPYDTAIDRDGNIYVVDSGSGKIIIYDKRGTFLDLYDGRANKTLHTPLGITISDKGFIAVADKRLASVIIFNKDFKVVRKLPEIFPIKPLFNDDKLYVTTFKHLSIYSDDGRLINRTGSRGKKWGQFDFPNGIAVTKDQIYISDSNNHRLQAFDKKTLAIQWVEGEPVSSPDDQSRRFDLPAGIAADEDSYLYLVDTFDCSVRILNKNGYEIATVGDFGINEGRFKYPTSITYIGNNRFLITDRGNNRIQAIDIFASKPGIKNITKSAKASVITMFVPLIAYRGLILGLIAFLIFAASFLVISKYARSKIQSEELG